jgi:hypothetical protein
MERRGVVWLIAVVVLTLAATALVPIYLRNGDEAAAPAAHGVGAHASFEGTLPASFEIDGGLTGGAPPSGFGLPNATRLRVSGSKVTGGQSRKVAKLLGADRLTGKETYSVDGTFDRKTDRVRAHVLWTLKGRAGTRLIDWRFDGTLDAAFATPTSLKGKLSSKATERDSDASGAGVPQVTSEPHAWDYDAIRGR